MSVQIGPCPCLWTRVPGTFCEGMRAAVINSTPSRRKVKSPVLRGPRERLNQLLVRIRQLEGDPHPIALGMALGIFVSFAPIIPLQTIAAVFLAYVVRGNKTAAALGSLFSNPLTIPVVYFANYKLGSLLIGRPPALESLAFDSIPELIALGMEVAWAMVLGGVAIGAVVSVVVYFVTFRIFYTFRRRSASDCEPGP